MSRGASALQATHCQRERDHFQAFDRDALAAILAPAVGAVVDALECGFDVGDGLSGLSAASLGDLAFEDAVAVLLPRQLVNRLLRFAELEELVGQRLAQRKAQAGNCGRRMQRRVGSAAA